MTSIRVHVASCVALLVAATAVAGGEAPPPTPSELSFPVTYARVWYRTGNDRGAFGPTRTGDLTLGENGILFSSRKDDRLVPLEAVRIVSLGTMRGDVDTVWVVLSVEEQGRRDVIGLRDGRKFGYGQRTQEIHDALLELTRRTHTGAYAAPPGFEPYTELKEQFALAVPEGWSSYHDEIVFDGASPVGGVLVFGPAAAGDVDREDFRERIGRGEATAWVVVRRPAGAGMGCDGFTDDAVARAARTVAAEPLLAGGVGDVAAAAPAPAPVDGCVGVRLTAVGGEGGAAAPALDLRAFSDGRTLFLIGLRTAEGRLEADREAFERGLATFRIAAAGRPR